MFKNETTSPQHKFLSMCKMTSVGVPGNMESAQRQGGLWHGRDDEVLMTC